MEEKLQRIEEKLSEVVRNKRPKNPEYKSKYGNGYTSGKQSDSLLTRTQMLNQHTAVDVLPEDERIIPDMRLLSKLQKKTALEDRIGSILKKNKHGYHHDQDKIYLGENDNFETGNETALSRNSFFRDLNKFNVVSGKRVSPMEQAMLYK